VSHVDHGDQRTFNKQWKVVRNLLKLEVMDCENELGRTFNDTRGILKNVTYEHSKHQWTIGKWKIGDDFEMTLVETCTFQITQSYLFFNSDDAVDDEKIISSDNSFII